MPSTPARTARSTTRFRLSTSTSPSGLKGVARTEYTPEKDKEPPEDFEEYQNRVQGSWFRVRTFGATIGAMDTSRHTVAVPEKAVPLDAWSKHPWTDGVQVDELPPLEAVEVQTRNTRYQIVVVDGRNGEVLVTGGRFFPVATRARVNGCTLGGSCLKWRGVYPGLPDGTAGRG